VIFQTLQAARSKSNNRRAGFSLVELLISLVILGVVVLLSLGLTIPLRLTRTSNLESQALNFSKSYLELVKVLWLQPNKYGPDIATVNTDFNATTPSYWPKINGTGYDLKLPTGWTMTATVTSANNASAVAAPFASVALKNLSDTLRLVKITATPPTNSGANPVTLTTLITRPSTGVTTP
jgi:prepilin-type N-terminal cleavage/methylation domain-containing protein